MDHVQLGHICFLYLETTLVRHLAWSYIKTFYFMLEVPIVISSAFLLRMLFTLTKYLVIYTLCISMKRKLTLQITQSLLLSVF